MPLREWNFRPLEFQVGCRSNLISDVLRWLRQRKSPCAILGLRRAERGS